MKTGPSLDGANTVSWTDLDDPFVIAAAYLWWYANTKELLEFDIVMNSGVSWSIVGGSYDIPNVATHEAGHTVSLDDLRPRKDSELTMYAYTAQGETKKRDLGVGDILGVQALYGE